MIPPASLLPGAGNPAAARLVRGFLLALVVVLASGVALAAWSATGERARPQTDALLRRGPLLDRLLDQVQASPAQRDQAHQIFDAADTPLRRDRRADHADRTQIARLFAQATVDTAAVEAVRVRMERRHDDETRRSIQALIDVGLVLNARQRQAIAGALADGPRALAGFLLPNAAAAARND